MTDDWTLKGQALYPDALNLNISKSVRDRVLVPIEHLQEIVYWEWNGHVTDDIT